ncbi:rhamnogalacturonan acetylesterase [Streptomyces sp. NBC_01016]|uniref:rhamnogalacturonan acetylesterase n=1 Tax=Streptomyces sp. NBC_01016 TaxID=2903720 RepID=UPI002257BD92|nr:rhamnogalacturonan acetylesterase [Streptomyces sp. NBC_01016]MCX4830772.1 rhamnogalacturonan acetylesterase [Streptomyces sp. NBC_01016]
MSSPQPQASNHAPRVFVAGDSTAVTRPNTHLPMTGWAQALHLFLADEVEVVNCARARSSSKSFRERGRLRWILEQLAPGDYFIVGFGQIDWKPDPGLHTEPFDDFQEHLRAYICGTRDAQAHPVILLPYERRRVDRHSNVSRFLGDYPLAMRELAREEHVPVVDLYGQSVAWWEELGPEDSKRAFTYLRPGEPLMGVVLDADNVHVRPEGAIECARFVARSLLEQEVLPAHLVQDLGRRTFSYEELGWLDEATYDRLTKERVSRRPAPEGH